MNTTISNHGLPVLPQAPSSQGNAPAQGSGSSTDAAAASKSSDQVVLTDSARALQSAARTGDTPVDEQRVDGIRQAIAAGSYQVNPGYIADRMLSLDSQFGASSGPSGI